MKKSFMYSDMIIVLLASACVVLCAALAIAKPFYLIPIIVVLLILFVVFAFSIKKLRATLRTILHGAGYAESDTQFSFNKLPVPVMILAGKDIIWYNEAFQENVLNKEEFFFAAVTKTIPEFDAEKACEIGGQAIKVNDKLFTIYGSGARLGGGLFVAYLIDDTILKQQAEEYLQARPSVMHIIIDTYEEILKELKESERAQLISEIDLALERYIGKTSGFLRRISASRYIMVVEERHMREMERNRFDLLDTVRSIGNENIALTLSIGVGRCGKTLQECEAMSLAALDMALGRGGDQVAVKSENGFEFYGGVSRSVEKRSKVKSRIIAKAMRDLVEQSDSVLIMGHKTGDLDSIGSAIGILRFCKMCEKPAVIVVNKKHCLAQALINQFEAAGFGDDFIAPEQAINDITQKTLLVVVDTHIKAIVDSNAVYEKCNNVVVIDHHRKAVDYIDNAVVFYHEPYASSASELVSELLQYSDSTKGQKLTPLEAQALMAGITLDTRNFSVHTGVRTFEAAAFLRRMGAQTQEVKKLFSSSFDAYAHRARLVTDAQMFRGCAVVISESLPTDMQVVVPQAANDLLTIDGVEASFVAVENNGQVNISARSLGAVNVQVVMECLGGGGHLTMAGAQMRDTSLAHAQQAIFDAIAAYRDNQTKIKE